jgi:hypothetical protein
MNTVTKLERNNDALMGPLRRKLNKGLMVAWINANLLDRYGHDVRKSIVFYDEEGVFEAAMLASQWEQLSDELRTEFLQKLYAATPIRYYSKGI